MNNNYNEALDILLKKTVVGNIDWKILNPTAISYVKKDDKGNTTSIVIQKIEDFEEYYIFTLSVNNDPAQKIQLNSLLEIDTDNILKNIFTEAIKKVKNDSAEILKKLINNL